MLFLTEENYQKCISQQLTLQDINAQFIPQHPAVPFSFIQSKTDVVQMSFYTSVGLSMGLPAFQTPAQFYDDVNTIFEVNHSPLVSPHLTIQGYNVNPNFLTYLVSGDQHCFTPLSLYYTSGCLPF
jgi:hypothetical protein